MAGHHYLFMSTEAAKFEYECNQLRKSQKCRHLSPEGRLAFGEPNALPPTSLYLDQRLTNFQAKPPALLGSGNSISEHDVVSKFPILPGHVLVSSFEYESAPYCIHTAKGRLRAHYNVWSQTLY